MSFKIISAKSQSYPDFLFIILILDHCIQLSSSALIMLINYCPCVPLCFQKHVLFLEDRVLNNLSFIILIFFYFYFLSFVSVLGFFCLVQSRNCIQIFGLILHVKSFQMFFATIFVLMIHNDGYTT